MGFYRHDLDAAVTRIELLEAQLAEKSALLTARDAALAARQAELRSAERRLEELQSEPGNARERRRSSAGLVGIGAATLLLSLGLSEAFDRAERAEARYVEARSRLEGERQESAEARAMHERRLARDAHIFEAFDDRDLAEATERADGPVAAVDDERIAELLERATNGEADMNDLRLLRARCSKVGREDCYRFALERLRHGRSLGF